MGPPWGVGAGAEGGAEEAVDDEVGVAADGAGEVGVGGAGEGEVAFVFFAVAGLLERAQHEEGEDAFLRGAGNFGGEALVHLGGYWDALWDVMGLRLRGHGLRGGRPWRGLLRWSDFMVNFLTGREEKPRVWP